MSIVKTPTDIDTLKINYLTQEMYDAALENDEINENELYLTPSDGSGGNTNSVELTQAEYDALTTEEKNNGTIYFITDGTPSNLIVNDSVPIGAIQAYGGATAPAGWLMCDGSAVSRSAYSELYAAIGTAFGEGDGSTTFNLPDLRGRTIQGVGTLGTETYTLGDSKDAGLPNITGSFTARSTSYNTSNIIWTDDVLFSSSNAGSTADTVTQANGAQAMKLYTFDASKANAIYGNSTTVQPNTTIANYIIKAKDHSLLQANFLPMLDFFYPVGSYYETSDATYDPNVSMGGTWVSEAFTNDEIVEEGDTTEWKYRKWKSGRMELERHYSGPPATGSHYATVGGLYGYRVEGFAFDSDTRPIDGNYTVAASWIIGGGFVLDSGAIGSRDIYGFNLFAMGSAASVTTVSIDISIIALWKQFETPSTRYRWHRTA